MSFQDIFEISQSIGINDHRTVGQQVSRSGQMTVAQYLTAVPYVFTVKPHNFLYYPQARQIIADLRYADRQLYDSVQFVSNNLKWFTAYQGQFASPQSLKYFAIPAANSQTVVLTNLPSVASGTIAFQAGDFIQMGNWVYQVTQQVLRGSGTTISVPVHRPINNQYIVANNYIDQVGNNCFFYIQMESYPTYTLMPMTNGAWIQWDGDFVFREALGQV
jgi:hypothetical protein